ncbi:hypothetical protein Jiend_22430 [Micromonospora endophytica]|nr:hypothetical protein Jiend_22430 [Micromonospora endophytica]
MAGGEQPGGKLHDLLLGEPVLLLVAGLDHRAEQVVGGLAAPLLDQLADVAVQVVEVLLDPLGVSEVVETIASDQTWNRCRSANGTPSSSQITWIGNGVAKCSTRSTGGPAATMASISSSAICRARGRSCSTRRAVNALATSRRSRVCSGGSIDRMPSPICRGVSRGSSRPTLAARLNLASPRTVRTSA